MSKVSIVIPTYNRAELMRQTLDSVLAQTYRDLEVIVTDNASTDDTPDIMRAYCERDKRIRYIRKPVNDGALANFNTGFTAATGDYVGVLDSDDLIAPTKIEKQVALLRATPDADVAHTCFYYMDENGVLIDKTMMLREGDLFEAHLKYEALIWLNSVIMTRKCADYLRHYDPLAFPADDIDMMIRAARGGFKFVCVQEPLYSHRFHSSNMTLNTRRMTQAIVGIYERLYAEPEIAEKFGAWKNYAFGNVHIDCAARHYVAGEYDIGATHLEKALVARPEWLNDPSPLIHRLIYAYAVGPTSTDGVKMVNGIFDHLPLNADALSPHRPRFVSIAMLGEALRAYRRDEYPRANELILQAQKINPRLKMTTNDFESLVHHYAATLPMDDPTPFVQKVFRHLPQSASVLRRVEAKVTSSLMISDAFFAYHRKDGRRTTSRVLSAIRKNPLVALNRGVVSIFLRSLPRLFAT
jgi:glycosyltransferase involved in cell wall biosynthesis